MGKVYTVPCHEGVTASCRFDVARGLEDQHRVAEGVEAIALRDRELVEAARLLDSREGHHEREQGRARQVEVGQQRVDAAKLEARRNEQRRPALQGSTPRERL